jgi:hypothetical protein
LETEEFSSRAQMAAYHFVCMSELKNEWHFIEYNLIPIIINIIKTALRAVLLRYI